MKLRVGLTGGIGSGKSEVAGFLEVFGAFIIDADLLAHRAAAPQSEGLEAIRRVWPAVVSDQGLDRSALAQIVFADPGARDQLNAIIHPLVRRMAADQERSAGPDQIVVHVVPLLFESGYADRCDATILVTAPQTQRIKRVSERDHLSESQIRARMAAQIPPTVARKRATYCIENDADLAHLRERTSTVYKKLLAKSERRSTGSNTVLRIKGDK